MAGSDVRLVPEEGMAPGKHILTTKQLDRSIISISGKAFPQTTVTHVRGLHRTLTVWFVSFS